MMAVRDYIVCGSCECKIIYDGHNNGRNMLEENWGDPSKDFWTVSLYCPTCLLDVIAERDALRDQVARLVGAIEAAPHERWCATHGVPGTLPPLPLIYCNCWLRTALEGK
jgi:hypothetical protein